MAQACGLQHEDHRHWQDGTESRYEILEKYTHEKLSDALNLVFVELGRFRKKSLHDIDDDKERFYFCLLHMHEFTGMPEELKGNNFFERLFRAADFEAMSITEKDQYIRFMTTERDLINQRQYALEQSWLKGMAEGEAKGKAEGAAEAEAAIVGKLLASGMPVSEISRITEIPEEKIQSMV